MYKGLFFLLILVFSFVTSCRSSRQEVQKNDKQSESIKEHVVYYKDTILYTPKSVVSLKLPASLLTFNSDMGSLYTPKIYSKKNGNANAHVSVDQDGINVTATCDSLAIRAQIKQEFQREINHLKESNTKDQKRTKGVPGFRVLLYILLSFIIGFGTAYLLKTFKII